MEPPRVVIGHAEQHRPGAMAERAKPMEDWRREPSSLHTWVAGVDVQWVVIAGEPGTWTQLAAWHVCEGTSEAHCRPVSLRAGWKLRQHLPVQVGLLWGRLEFNGLVGFPLWWRDQSASEGCPGPGHGRAEAQHPAQPPLRRGPHPLLRARAAAHTLVSFLRYTKPKTESQRPRFWNIKSPHHRRVLSPAGYYPAFEPHG